MAAAQFAVGTDVGANLATCVRMLDEAAATGAELVVLPEFCNHLSVYDGPEHCRAVAVPLDGDWLGRLARRAAHHSMYAALAVTVPRVGGRVTVTSVLIGPDGRITATADKQMLMGNERAYLSAGERPAAVAGTAFGPIGLYACMDGVTFETPRALAVSGARLLCNSLNSFARDEAGLHVPVRAVENGVWVAAANKVGSLLPEGRAQEFAEALGVPAEALEGAGESQIVDPDGTVVAKAPPTGEAVVAADVDLTRCRPQRLDGRRPQVYGPLAGTSTTVPRATEVSEVKAACIPGAQADPALKTACVPGARQDPELISDALQPPELIGEAFSAGALLVVLLELTPPPANIPAGVLVVTTAKRDGQHVGQVWTAGGLVHEQPQIHHSDRYPDVTRLGEGISLYPTSFGDMAVIVGDDHRHPRPSGWLRWPARIWWRCAGSPNIAGSAIWGWSNGPPRTGSAWPPAHRRGRWRPPCCSTPRPTRCGTPTARPSSTAPSTRRCASGPPRTTACWSGPCIRAGPLTGKSQRTPTWSVAGP